MHFAPTVLYFLFIISPFFICSDPDIGDKYSVFRQLEQPADKKPVGKEVSQSFTFKSLSVLKTHTNSYWQIHWMAWSIYWALTWSLKAHSLRTEQTLKNDFKSSVKMLLWCLNERVLVLDSL